MESFAPPSSCPRCRGAMITEKDWYGEYATCLSCEYVHEDISSPLIELLEEEQKGQRKRRRQPSHYTDGQKIKM